MNKNVKINNPMKVITGPDTRWSYANVWEPKSINGGTPKYSVSLIIPKSDTKTIAKIEAAIEAAYKEGEAKLKIILETCLLTREEIVLACQLAKAAGADFVKTSTGFSTGGATAEDVALMRETVGPDMGVKASGGIRDLASARAMLAAGADRIGTSAGVKIVLEEQAEG